MIHNLIGKIFTSVYVVGDNELVFSNDQEEFLFHHQQDCCEHVYINDICGDLSDLVNFPILISSEDVNSGNSENYESETWTFYNFATIKGSVTVRWHGSSNGYYSESVSIKYINKMGH